MTNPTYYRFRHKWAHSINEWEYRDISLSAQETFASLEEDIANELMEEWNYSDKYRGIDIEEVERPPVTWVLNELTSCTQRQSYLDLRKQMLQALLDTYETWEEDK